MLLRQQAAKTTKYKTKAKEPPKALDRKLMIDAKYEQN
jgi:hypothetical protein